MTSTLESLVPPPSDLARRYNQNVPRYTSYPTAPHFGAEVDASLYRNWLSALDPAAPLSLYLHIPFCDTLCWFCGCYTKIVRRYEPVAAYLEVLQREIDLVASAMPQRMTVRHIHWGGGSPTILRPDDWRALTSCLARAFDAGDDTERAVELDPRDTTRDYVAALAEAGVNRVSIGVQDIDPVVQAAVNRVQPFDIVERVCAWLREHGIDRINLDLMYGLPHQTVSLVEAMVERALSVAPSRVALFGYAHVPWMRSHQRLIDEPALPSAEERLSQVEAATAVLRQAGYEAIGLDHFARADDPLATARAAGRLRRNFQGYTTDSAPALLGLGASSIGSLPQGYVQNTAPLEQYRARILAGTLATARGRALDDDDRLRRDIIERIMCDLAVDLDAVADRHGAAAEDFGDTMDRLRALADDGLVRVEGRRIVVTEAGRPFTRLVAAAFDRYLANGSGRHSNAV
jgi:oxygen-independent coproporphyrinogen III oxidase